ncbi:MAG TPA: alpha-amylase family glycosyl hydrolase [Blastocatellia bacterium]|nr:alpha-amylase family glycosyl hydrolase [Blastocatellia bacterium]
MIKKVRGGSVRLAPTNFFFAALVALALACPQLPPAAANTNQSAPVVERVDPPSWWAAHSINPVRLLIQGRNLQFATASVAYTGVRISEVSTDESGSYLFASLHISPSTRAGAFDIRIKTANGATTARFAIKPRLANQGRFQGFSPDDVIYLIMPDRFADGDRSNNDPAESAGLYSRANPRAYHGGDIQGIIDRLPYLKRLGVTAIWMTPVYDNTSRAKDFEWGKNVTDYHGYGAINFYRVEEHLGTVEKYRELTDRAHAAGIKIIQDQIANHTGPDHPWNVVQPTRTWLNGTRENHLNNVFDIKSVTDQNPDRERMEATLRGWFADRLPDINQDDPESARYVIQNAVWWVETVGLDAIRQDTFPYAPRRFWAAWNLALRRAFPRLAVVGEVFDSRPEVTSFFQGGRKQFDGVDTHLHTVFDFPSYFAMREVFIKDQSMKKLADVIAGDALYPDPRVLVTFIGNHDVKRFMSEEGASLSRLKSALAYLLTMRGTPQLYYGDEIGMAGGDDPDNRKDFPGGFAGDARNAFTNAGRTAEQREIYNHVNALLRFRAAHRALRGGRMRVLAAADSTLAFLREQSGDRVIVAFNNSDRPADVELDVIGARAWVEAMPARGRWRTRAANGKMRVPLQPRDWKILVERL